jgi:DNA-binding Lrp family transcriptional regulator
MRRSGGTRDLDETDRRLCELLGADPRASNRSLAAAVGVTDETVAARLRRLRDQGVLATTVVVDWEAAGYTAQAMVRVAVAGRPFRDAIVPLLEHPATLAATETSGACDGVLTVVGRSLAEIHHYVTELLNPLPGIGSTRVEVVIGDLKVPPAILTLPIPPWDPAELPAPRLPLDEIDLALVRELTFDGHESNSELARRLGVSDATVRRRIQRLEEAGLLAVVAAFDPVATGDLAAVALAFCRTAGPMEEFTAEVRATPIVLAGYRSLGESTAILLLGAPSDTELQEYVSTEFRRLPGLVSSDLAITHEVLVHRSHLARVTPTTRSP